MSASARSEALFEQARELFPGGVNSPVRAFRAVGGTPRFMDRGQGPFLYDADGYRYVDYVLSWGPLVLGHAHPAVVEAVASQAARGTSFGAPTELESELARLITSFMPALEMLRFVSSGTEAAMSAVRLARAFTGREKIVKFDGCYHGHADPFLVRAGSGAATLGLPDSPGVPAAATADTLSAPFNNLAAVEAVLMQHRGQVAAIIVEPVPGNMGLVLPKEGFLDGLRRLANGHGALLVFDEVITGFRLGLGGAQERFGVRPDLTCLGKVIGGGLPAAAYGGRREIMELVAPEGPMYQAGTLSGNPLAMAAGIATLRELSRAGMMPALERAAERVREGIAGVARNVRMPFQSTAIGSMWGFRFAEKQPTDYATARQADARRYAVFFHAMLERGVYLPPSQFETCFVSTAHDDAAISHTIEAAAAAFAALRYGA